MSTYSYKCPSCSASLIYNPNIEKLECEYCKSQFSIEEINKSLLHNPNKTNKFENDNVEDDSKNKEEKIKGYVCNNCAAEVVTDETTLTTFCYFCHSPIVIENRVIGNFKPDYIIPFKYDKRQAEEIFYNWASKKRYVEKEFYSNSQLSKITGVYLPYWSVDVTVNIDLEATAYKQDINRIGNQKITTIENYSVVKSGRVNIDNINEIANSKFDKNLLDTIEPFNLKEAKPFEIFYLNGFFSEIYDIGKEDVEEKINYRLKDYKSNLVSSILSEYNSYELNKNVVEEVSRDWKYVLLPTWILTYDYNGKKYIYAMNGETGNTNGEIPINKKLIVRDSILIASVVFILILLGGYFIW